MKGSEQKRKCVWSCLPELIACSDFCSLVKKMFTRMNHILISRTVSDRLAFFIPPHTTLLSYLQISMTKCCVKSKISMTKCCVKGKISMTKRYVKGKISMTKCYVKGKISMTKCYVKGKISMTKCYVKGKISMTRCYVKGKISKLCCSLTTICASQLVLTGKTILNTVGIRIQKKCFVVFLYECQKYSHIVDTHEKSHKHGDIAFVYFLR